VNQDIQRMVQLHENQLRQMLSTAAEMGAKEALREAGLDKTQVSKAEAYRRYSRKRVDGWIKNEKIIPVKIGNSVLLNITELEAVSQTNLLFNKHLQNV
jgi:hypothetical protein